jgi:hypothetical protein
MLGLFKVRFVVGLIVSHLRPPVSGPSTGGRQGVGVGVSRGEALTMSTMVLPSLGYCGMSRRVVARALPAAIEATGSE